MYRLTIRGADHNAPHQLFRGENMTELEQANFEFRVQRARAEILEQQRNEVIGFYHELRQAFYDHVGFDWQPTGTIRNRVAPTEEDRVWLKSIGINIDGGGDGPTIPRT
jgi:hypothetical protein